MHSISLFHEFDLKSSFKIFATSPQHKISKKFKNFKSNLDRQCKLTYVRYLRDSTVRTDFDSYVQIEKSKSKLKSISVKYQRSEVITRHLRTPLRDSLHKEFTGPLVNWSAEEAVILNFLLLI